MMLLVCRRPKSAISIVNINAHVMRMSTSSSSSAGMAAFELRRKIEQDKLKGSCSWRTSMATKLSHAGLATHYTNDTDVDDQLKRKFNSPMSPSIELATTYERPPCGDYAGGMVYSRSCNPTRRLLEKTMGQLEMTNHSDEDGSNMIAPTYAFASGMAAVASLLLACKSPTKILIPSDVYHGVPTQLYSALNDHGIMHESVDMTNCNEIQQKIEENIGSATDEGCLVVWLETPSNPLCQVTDIQAVCNIVQNIRSQNKRILIVVDSTWAPPCISRPLLLGADAVLHSGTKYL